MRGALPILLATAAFLLAQSGVGPPLTGFIRNSTGELRPVYGVAGSFVLGSPAATGVVWASFSGRTGMFKTQDKLVVFDASGRTVGEMPAEGFEEPALPLKSDDQELIWQRSDGTEIRTKLETSPAGIEQMGDGWYHVWDERRHLAVRTVRDQIEVYRLPGPESGT